jgi:dihydroorotase
MYVEQSSAGIDPGVLIANARLVDRDRDERGAVFVRDGRIVGVYAGAEADRLQDELENPPVGCGSAGAKLPDVFDARGAVLMPAFVDLHAHFRDPGMTHKEDVLSASRAACAGGYGTVVLMANTSPVISSESAAREVNRRVGEVGLVDAFQAVSLTRDFGGADTEHLSGLNPRIVPVATEDGREVADPDVMLAAMKKCAAAGVLVSCHCEDPALAGSARPFRERALDAAHAAGFPAGALHDASGATPPSVEGPLAETESILRRAEDSMTERNLALAEKAGCRVHIAHVSTAGALAAVRAAKVRASTVKPGASDSRAFSVTCEVTPHHLSMTCENPEIVNPPLRSESDRAALVAGILDGTVDAIATDHAPHTAADKSAGAPGFSGIQIAFPVCNTSLVRTGLINLPKLSALMSANPAAVLGVNRGLLRSGMDADLVLVDPDAENPVDPESPGWYSRGLNTPLAGVTLRGKIRAVWHRGRPVFPFR